MIVGFKNWKYTAEESYSIFGKSISNFMEVAYGTVWGRILRFEQKIKNS